ncbi:MAG: Na/Pi cotransporter family protein, partial [Roseibium sp.]|nr:Na/Pi cotransporter family protein [Roseibium sp.]
EFALPLNETSGQSDQFAPQSSLDERVVHIPRLALASATRELLRMGEIVEAMARPVMMMLERGTEEEIRRLQRLDADVNKIHSDIKLYIAEVNRGELTSEEAEQSME